MTKKLYEETSIQAIADAIRGKNGTSNTYKIADMAGAITDLPSGGVSEPVLWCGGRNPELVQTIALTLNLSSDTSYNDTTISTTSKTICTNSQSVFTQQSNALNLGSYDYIVIHDVIIPHKYTSTPAYANTLATADKRIYKIGRRYNSTSSTPNYQVVTLSGTAPLIYYQNASGTKYRAGSTAYGIGLSAVAPTIATTTAASTTINCLNPSITVRTSSTYMNTNSWQYIDADATNCYCRWQIFRVDRPDQTTKSYLMLSDDAVRGDGTLTDNFILVEDL